MGPLPLANQQWSSYVTLPDTDAESSEFGFEFPRPVYLVGWRPSVASAVGGLAAPQLSDLLLAVSSDVGERRWTEQQGRGIPNARDYVDAEALDTTERRVLGIVFDAPSSLVVRGRWKVPTLASGTLNDAVIGLTIWGRYVTQAQAAALLERLQTEL